MVVLMMGDDWYESEAAQLVAFEAETARSLEPSVLVLVTVQLVTLSALIDTCTVLPLLTTVGETVKVTEGGFAVSQKALPLVGCMQPYAQKASLARHTSLGVKVECT